MGLKNANVLAKKSRERNGLGWREREVEEYPAIGRSRATFGPRAVQSLRQRLSCCGMLVLAKPQEIIRTHIARETEPSSTDALPFPGHALALIVVVANAKVFLKVFPRVRQVVLRLCRDHTTDAIRTPHARCVGATSTHPLLVLNCLREHEHN